MIVASQCSLDIAITSARECENRMQAGSDLGASVDYAMLSSPLSPPPRCQEGRQVHSETQFATIGALQGLSVSKLQMSDWPMRAFIVGFLAYNSLSRCAVVRAIQTEARPPLSIHPNRSGWVTKVSSSSNCSSTNPVT